MKHHIQVIRRYQHEKWALCLVLIFMGAAILLYATHTPILSPCPGECKITTMHPLTPDQYVDMYANKYGKTTWEKNRTKALLHFLLLREAGYGNSKACGDSGLACGPLQFHEQTYIGYRKIMMKRGLTIHMGNRFDMEDAIETCAWAISDGRENAWGPVYRGEIIL